MGRPSPYVVFSIDAARYALPLANVQRIVRMVSIVSVPDVAPFVRGVVNVQGQIVPVLDARKCFHLKERDAAPTDQLIIVQAAGRTMALVADSVSGVIERDAAEIVAADEILPGLRHLQSAVKLDDGMILVHDLEKIAADLALGTVANEIATEAK